MRSDPINLKDTLILKLLVIIQYENLFWYRNLAVYIELFTKKNQLSVDLVYVHRKTSFWDSLLGSFSSNKPNQIREK